jgi:hypothetical protein
MPYARRASQHRIQKVYGDRRMLGTPQHQLEGQVHRWANIGNHNHPEIFEGLRANTEFRQSSVIQEIMEPI